MLQRKHIEPGQYSLTRRNCYVLTLLIGEFTSGHHISFHVRHHFVEHRRGCFIYSIYIYIYATRRIIFYVRTHSPTTDLHPLIFIYCLRYSQPWCITYIYLKLSLHQKAKHTANQAQWQMICKIKQDELNISLGVDKLRF